MNGYFSVTKYDDNHEPIMTTLFHYIGINETEVLIAVAGWKSHDDMLRLWKNRK